MDDANQQMNKQENSALVSARKLPWYFNITIEEVEKADANFYLHTKAKNILENKQIHTLGDIADHDREDIDAFPSIGQASMTQLDAYLNICGGMYRNQMKNPKVADPIISAGEKYWAQFPDLVAKYNSENQKVSEEIKTDDTQSRRKDEFVSNLSGMMDKQGMVEVIQTVPEEIFDTNLREIAKQLAQKGLKVSFQIKVEKSENNLG